jgi:RND family efflux transporter MFP subunit
MKHDIETLAKLKIERHEPPTEVKAKKQASILRDLIVFLIGTVSGAAGLSYMESGFDLESAFLQPLAVVPDTGSQPTKNQEANAKDVSEELAPSAATKAAAFVPTSAALEATGYVRAPRRIQAVPQIGGKVEAVFFDIGEHVEKGDILASLDDEYAQIAHDQAKLTLKREQAVLSETKLSLELAEAQLERNRLLSNKGLLTSRTLQESEVEVAILNTRFLAQQQATKLADANLRLKALDLKKHLVRAAFSGVIVERFASPGDYVSPTSSATQSGSNQGLATLVDTSSIDAVVDVSEKLVSQIQPGQSVLVSGNGADIPDMPGRVSKVIPMVDRGRATVKILIKLDEYDARFLADMGVRVRFFSSTNISNQGH